MGFPKQNKKERRTDPYRKAAVLMESGDLTVWSIKPQSICDKT